MIICCKFKININNINVENYRKVDDIKINYLRVFICLSISCFLCELIIDVMLK